MNGCACTEPHEPRRIVLTGGPGAGKTAVLELMRKTLCKHIKVLPESAGIVFGGGFPRGDATALRRAGQRAIFYVQRELEEAASAEDVAISLCDRGTIDGLAYWPGPDDLWPAVGTSLAEQLARYHAVIHLRTPSSADYNHQNPLRVETAVEAAAIDARRARGPRRRRRRRASRRPDRSSWRVPPDVDQEEVVEHCEHQPEEQPVDERARVPTEAAPAIVVMPASPKGVEIFTTVLAGPVADPAAR